MNIYIPYTPRFFTVNMNLFLLTKEHPEWFQFDTKIVSTYGSFAYCRWNGGRLLTEDGMTDELIQNTFDLYNSLGIKFRLTFTNSFVTEEYLNDDFANRILDMASESGINEVLINNSLIKSYIENKYKNKFEFIQSVTKCDRDIDSINKSCKEFKLVVIDYRDGQDDAFLNKIIDKDKAEIMLNDICVFKCPQRLEHHLDQQRAILAGDNWELLDKLGFKGITCPYQIYYTGKVDMEEFKDYIERPDLGTLSKDRFIEVYNLGFRNFKVVGRDLDYDRLALHYTYYLSKDEYMTDFLKELLNTDVHNILERLDNYYLY